MTMKFDRLTRKRSVEIEQAHLIGQCVCLSITRQQRKLSDTVPFKTMAAQLRTVC